MIARNSSFTYKDRAVDVKQISAELGVRYVLEGSVRKAGTRVRITAQLLEGTAGAHLWAERYDRDLDDIFAVQDEITETIVGAIEPKLGSSERKRARRKPPERLDAWESYQRGMLHFYQFTREGFADARRFFKRAIELDRNFGSAHAALVINDGWAYNTGFIESQEVLVETLRLAQSSVALDERDPFAYRALGFAYTIRGELEDAIPAMEKAVDLNPNFADGFESLGTTLCIAGRFEMAIAQLETAIRLSPHSPELWQPMNLKGYCLLMLNQYEEAVDWARRSIRAFESRHSSSDSDAAPTDLHSSSKSGTRRNAAATAGH